MRHHTTCREKVAQLFFVASELVRCYVLELKPRYVHALHEHQVERDVRDDAGCIADGDEAAAAAQSSQCGFGELATNGVNDGVGSFGKCLPKRGPQITRSMVDQMSCTVRSCHIELFGRRGDRGDGRAKHDAELDGGEADP